jgi:hypothetical protein
MLSYVQRLYIKNVASDLPATMREELRKCGYPVYKAAAAAAAAAAASSKAAAAAAAAAAGTASDSESDSSDSTWSGLDEQHAGARKSSRAAKDRRGKGKKRTYKGARKRGRPAKDSMLHMLRLIQQRGLLEPSPIGDYCQFEDSGEEITEEQELALQQQYLQEQQELEQ